MWLNSELKKQKNTFLLVLALSVLLSSSGIVKQYFLFFFFVNFSLKHVWSIKRKWNDCCRTPIKMKTLYLNGLIVCLKHAHTSYNHTCTLAYAKNVKWTADSPICRQNKQNISHLNEMCVVFLCSLLFIWIFFVCRQNRIYYIFYYMCVWI